MWYDVKWLRFTRLTVEVLKTSAHLAEKCREANLLAASSFKYYDELSESSWQTPRCQELNLLCHKVKRLAKFSSYCADLVASKSVWYKIDGCLFFKNILYLFFFNHHFLKPQGPRRIRHTGSSWGLPPLLSVLGSEGSLQFLHDAARGHGRVYHIA